MINSMSSNRIAKFGSGGGVLRNTNGLDFDTIRGFAPTVFAEDKHESRSERYTYIPTNFVLEGLAREGFTPVEVRKGGSRIEGKREFTKHMIRLRHQSDMMKEAEQLNELILINSHDGTSSYQLMSGVFRLVCSNGLVVADGDMKTVRIPHKGDIIGNVIEGAYEIIKGCDAVNDKIEHMQSIQLDAIEQQILAKHALSVRMDKDLGIQPNQVLAPRRREDDKNDLWSTMNRIQENLIQGGIRYNQLDSNGRVTARRYTQPVNAVDTNVKINKAVWALAEEMRAIKSMSNAA